MGTQTDIQADKDAEIERLKLELHARLREGPICVDKDSDLKKQVSGATSVGRVKSAMSHLITGGVAVRVRRQAEERGVAEAKTVYKLRQHT